MKQFLVLLSCCILSISATAQNPWRNYTTENSALLSNQVGSIIIDHQNNLWVAYNGVGGNGEGISKFDGTNWTHYNTSNSGLPNNDIRAMASDANGSVWFGCYNAGLVKFDGTNWTRFTTSNSGIAGNGVTAIQVDQNNNLWIGGYFDGVSKFDGTNWTVYKSPNAPFNPTDNCINSLTLDKDDNVWVGLGCAGGLAVLNTTTGVWKKYTTANSGLAHHSVSAVTQDNLGKMWIGYPSLENILTSFDGTTWETIAPFESSSGGGISYDGFTQDRSGNLWAGAYRGLYKYDGTSWSKIQVGASADKLSGFNQSVAVDRFRGIWWSEQGQGIWTNNELQEYPWFEDTGIEFNDQGGYVKWVNVDNDSDLDLVSCGSGGMRVYENQEGSFVLRSTGLPSLSGGFAFGDYDQDGDQDIVIGGLTASSTNQVELYENLGGFQFSLKQSFFGVHNVTASWADIDNDNDLDFVLAGADHENAGELGIEFRIFLYENVNGVFTEVPDAGGITPCSQCALEWADVNGDGKIDLLASGFTQHAALSMIYLNNGDKTFTQDTNSPLETLYNGDAKWGDYDRDGDMDLLITGFGEAVGGPNTARSYVYENKNGKLTKRTDITLAGASEVLTGGSAWADINNDGLLDILVSGRSGTNIEIKVIFELYINDGAGSFVNIPSSFPAIANSSLDAGDYDNDGDLDICFAGLNSNGLKVYRNLFVDVISLPNPQNSKPLPPSVETFTENYDGHQVVLSWGDGDDNTTPVPSISYNYYLRNASNTIVSPAATLETGYITTSSAQNGLGQKAIVNAIPEGEYFWAVQSVDGGKQGSEFSEEKTLNLIYGPQDMTATILDAGHVKLEWINYSDIALSNQLQRSNKQDTEYIERASLLPELTSYVDVNAFITDSIYYYRISAVTGSGMSHFSYQQLVIPAPPDQVSVQEINFSSLEITWNDNSDYETGYWLERRKQGEDNFSLLAELSIEDLSYTDTDLQEYTQYEYRISPRSSNGGIYSEIVGARTNLRPQGVALSAELLEDESYTFTAADFSDSFLDSNDGDVLVHVEIASLPELGKLMLAETAVTIGQTIPASSLGSLQFVPDADENGSAAFNVYVNDGKDNSAEVVGITLSITPVNDPPTLAAINDIELESGLNMLTGVVIGDIDNSIESLTVSATSSNQSVVTNEGLNFSGTINVRTFTIEPEGAGGESIITVTVSDGDKQATRQFTFTVTVVTGTEGPVERLVRVYPNPFVEEITIEPKVPGQLINITISDLSGRVIKNSLPATGTVKLNLTDIKPGVYLLRIAGKNVKPEVHKIIKKN